MIDKLSSQLEINLLKRMKAGNSVGISDKSGYLSNKILTIYIKSMANMLNDRWNNESIVVVNGSSPNIENLVICYATLLAGKTFCCLNNVNYRRLKEGKLCNFGKYIDLSNSKIKDIADLSSSCFEEFSLKDNSCNPAYIVFTSGTTGNPKGIVIGRDSFSLYLEYINRLITKGIDGPFLDILSSPLFFDNAIFNIAIMCGSVSHTHIVDATEMNFRWMEDQTIKMNYESCIIYAAPSIIKKFARSGLLIELFKTRKGILGFGGEGYSWQEMQKDLAMLRKDVQIFNFYGPSECTCMCSSFSFKPNEIKYLAQKYKSYSPYPPLGTIFPYFKWRLVKSSVENKYESREFNRTEKLGELVLHGNAIMESYLEHKNSTPIKEFMTGDLCFIADDLLFFKGRTDNQCKVNGIRIELEEIDAVLNGIDGINDAAAIIIEDRFTYIVGYISTNDDKVISDFELRRKVKSEIGTQKCPAIFIKIDEIPLSLNGKIDRKALEEIYMMNLKL